MGNIKYVCLLAVEMPGGRFLHPEMIVASWSNGWRGGFVILPPRKIYRRDPPIHR
jgi:hypothetical protein